MRIAVSEIEEFYAGALGHLVRDVLMEKLSQAWGLGERLRIGGFGYAEPYLAGFTRADRRVALAPAGAGVRAGGAVPACLVDETAWPLADGSLDRLLIMHGMEETADIRRLLREAWRVLADDGLLIVAVANRRGPWALFETSPFAAGRPYSRRQLDNVLGEAMFGPTAHATALHFPPFAHPPLLRLARTWERLGETIEGWRLSPLFPNVAGVNLTEARKLTAVPIKGTPVEAFRPGVLLPGKLGHLPSARIVKGGSVPSGTGSREETA